jgi:hypothetical protein
MEQEKAVVDVPKDSVEQQQATVRPSPRVNFSNDTPLDKDEPNNNGKKEEKERQQQQKQKSILKRSAGKQPARVPMEDLEVEPHPDFVTTTTTPPEDDGPSRDRQNGAAAAKKKMKKRVKTPVLTPAPQFVAAPQFEHEELVLLEQLRQRRIDPREISAEVEAIGFLSAREVTLHRSWRNGLEQAGFRSPTSAQLWICVFCRLPILGSSTGRESERVVASCSHVYHVHCAQPFINAGLPSCILCDRRPLTHYINMREDEQAAFGRLRINFGDDSATQQMCDTLDLYLESLARNDYPRHLNADSMRQLLLMSDLNPDAPVLAGGKKAGTKSGFLNPPLVAHNYSSNNGGSVASNGDSRGAKFKRAMGMVVRNLLDLKPPPATTTTKTIQLSTGGGGTETATTTKVQRDTSGFVGEVRDQMVRSIVAHQLRLARGAEETLSALGKRRSQQQQQQQSITDDESLTLSQLGITEDEYRRLCLTTARSAPSYLSSSFVVPRDKKEALEQQQEGEEVQLWSEIRNLRKRQQQQQRVEAEAEATLRHFRDLLNGSPLLFLEQRLKTPVLKRLGLNQATIVRWLSLEDFLSNGYNIQDLMALEITADMLFSSDVAGGRLRLTAELFCTYKPQLDVWSLIFAYGANFAKLFVQCCDQSMPRFLKIGFSGAELRRLGFSFPMIVSHRWRLSESHIAGFAYLGAEDLIRYFGLSRDVLKEARIEKPEDFLRTQMEWTEQEVALLPNSTGPLSKK